MATYNGGKYIRTQIESILVQLAEGDELIVSDDNSKDDTLAIVNSFNDKRIKCFVSNENVGVVRNFERSVNCANGDFIFLADQDDVWKPDKVKVTLEYLNQFDIVVSDCEVFDGTGRVILPSYFAHRNSGSGVLKNIWANTYLGSCLAFRKELLKIAMPFPSDITLHDIWLGFIGDLFFKSFFIPQTLVSYRSHDANVSPTATGKSPHSLASRLLFRWNIVKYLPLLLYRKWIVP